MTKLEAAVSELVAKVSADKLTQQLAEIQGRGFQSPTVHRVVRGWQHSPPIVYQSVGTLVAQPLVQYANPGASTAGVLFF